MPFWRCFFVVRTYLGFFFFFEWPKNSEKIGPNFPKNIFGPNKNAFLGHFCGSEHLFWSEHPINMFWTKKEVRTTKKHPKKGICLVRRYSLGSSDQFFSHFFAKTFLKAVWIICRVFCVFFRCFGLLNNPKK